jgi:serine phosphatase RsbU (regulator of sigma subunit)
LGRERHFTVVDTDAVPSSFLDALFCQDEIGIGIWTRDLRYLRVNPALATMNGRTADEHVGRTITEVLPDLGPELEGLIGEVIESRTAAVGLEVSGQTPARPRSERHWRASYYPLEGRDGAVIGAGALVVEITDQKRAAAALERREREASYLAAVSASLSSSLDAKRTLRRFARLAVPRMADWCVIDMVADDGSLRRAALAHVDRSKEDLAWDLTRRYPSGPDAFEFTPKAIRSSLAELVPEIPASLLQRIAQDDHHLSLLQELGLRSLMIVPLTVRGRTLGAIGFVSAHSGRRYDRHDLALAQNLADRCALALDNARLYEERSRIATTLARSLLPPRLPDIAGVDLAARYRAGAAELEVGGDFYDVLETSDGSFAAAIGDVTGKGAPAAASTALARHTLHAAGRYEPSASGALRALNRELLEGIEERRSFLTAVYVRFERRAGSLDIEVAIGGHPQPLILRADGNVEPAGVGGMLLGFDPEPRLADSRHELRPGDALLLYTDGVTEGRPLETALDETGLARVLSGCAGLPADGIVDRVESAALERSTPHDDIAMLCLRFVGDGAT